LATTTDKEQLAKTKQQNRAALL